MIRRDVLALILPIALCGCPALGAFLAGAAPVAGAAIDAYAEHARAIAPGLPVDSPILAALARALADDDRCRAAVLAIPVPDAGPVAPSEAALVAQALEDSAAATRALLAAVAAAHAAAPPLPSSVLPFVDAGPGEGGS